MAIRSNAIAPNPGSQAAASAAHRPRGAAPAAVQTSRAGLLLGALGLASATFVLARLFETWRVSSTQASRHITVLGLRLGYPTANLGAIIVLALAAAGLLRPRVYVTSGAVALLDPAALAAVLAHERHHARRRDPLRLAAGRVLERSLFYVPGLSAVLERAGALAELSADERAVDEALGNRAALASAMLEFADSGSGSGIDPERIDQLLAGPRDWAFPALMCMLAAGALALVTGVALLASRLASGSATPAPPFLSRQPCVLVLAGVPAAAALLALAWARGWRRASVDAGASDTRQ